MSLPTQQNAWIIANPPSGPIQPDTFQLKKDQPLPELKDGELLVKIEYFSNDPAQRGWMQKDADPSRAYVPPAQAGEVVRATAIAKVLASKSSKWAVGSRVMGRFGWFDVGVVPESYVTAAAV